MLGFNDNRYPLPPVQLFEANALDITSKIDSSFSLIVSAQNARGVILSLLNRILQLLIYQSRVYIKIHFLEHVLLPLPLIQWIQSCFGQIRVKLVQAI